MRRFIRFLALFVVAFALPQWAHAWNFSDGQDPCAIRLNFDDEVTVNLNYSKTSEYDWVGEYTATSETAGYSLDAMWRNNGGEGWVTGYGEEYTNSNVGKWSTILIADEKGGKFKQSGLTSGVTYKVQIKGSNANDDKFSVRFVGPEEPFDFSNGTNPKAVAIQFKQSGKRYPMTFSDGVWSTDVELVVIETVGYVNYTIYATDKNGKEWKSGQDKGADTPGVWSDPADAKTFTKENYQGGVEIGKHYEIELTSAGSDTYKVKFAEAEDKAPETLYLYNMNGNNVTQLGTSANVGDTYTFTAEVQKGQLLILSKNGGATTLSGAQSHNGRFSPSGAKNVPGENIAFTQSTSGYWEATATGTYTFTVDWATKQLTAKADNVEFDGPASLYLYGTPWATFLGQAAAGSDGVFRYTVRLSTGQYVGLSTNPNAKSWEDMQKTGYTYYSPGVDKDIPGDGTAYEFSAAKGGSWKATKTGTYHIAVDWTAQTFKATYEEPIPPVTHMPLTTSDFAGGKKHYFIVGARMGEWRLQPEWELKQNGKELVLSNRYFYNSDFAIAVVDSYDDYIHHRYTYYDEGREYHINDKTLSSSGDLSTHPHRLELKKGETTAVGGTFYAAFDGGRQTDPYYQGRGAFIKEVKVTLNSDGLPTSMTFTKGTTAEAAKNRVFTLVGDNIYNRNYCNATDGGQTPLYDKGYSTDNGWQEGWIQFDPETNSPYVDGFGEYLYHTSYTPDYLMANPVQFNQTVGAGRASEFSFTSGEVQFVEYTNLPNLDTDPYKSFYKAFSGTETIDNNNAEKIGDGYNFTVQVENANPKTTPTADWNCYVVRDMWIAGEIKFWTGFGGNSTSESNVDQKTAIWHGPNGGPDIKEGGRKQVKGYDINSGMPAVLYKNVRNRDNTNYKISDGTPVYFNRVVLWFNNTDGVNASYIQFIQESAGPAIFAEVRENEAAGKKNYINYNWYLNKVQEGQEDQENLKVMAYEIRRYRMVDGVKTYIGHPEGVEPVDISGYNVTVKDLYEKNAQNYEFTKHLDTGITAGRGFAPGLYQYDIYVTYEGGVRKLALSNIVAIYDDELVAPDAVAMQLIELRDAYTDKYGTDHESGRETLGVEQRYLTYRPNDNANFYVMDMEEKDVVVGTETVKMTVPVNAEMIDAAKAISFINNNPDRYWWTSDYYVRCLDYNEYARTLQSYIDGGLIKDDFVPTPNLEVYETIDFTNEAGEPASVKQTHGLAQPFEFGDQTYYSLIVKRGGNLANATFDVTLRYSYTNADHETVTPVTTASTEINPVMPRPFAPLYRYVYDRPDLNVGGDEYKWGSVLVPLEDIPADMSKEEALQKGMLKEAYVKLDSVFDPRAFSLEVDFYRPNVNKDIYQFYDIQYNITVVNNDQTVVPLDMEAVLHDVDTSDDNFPNRYRMEFKGMHPRNGVWPVVKFVKTEYVPNKAGDESGRHFKSKTGNFGEMLEIEARRKMNVNVNPEGLQNVHLGKIQRADGTWDWMYKGHEHFQDDDETLENGNNKYEDTSNDVKFTPFYYLIQLTNGTEDATYEYLVPHYPNHHTGDKIEIDPVTGLIMNDTDPLIGTYIAKGFKSDDNPTIKATAIYVFERPITGTDPMTAVNFNRLEVESIKFNNNSGADAVAAATAAAAAKNNGPARVKDNVTNWELENGNCGDLPDTGVEPEGGVLDLSAENPTTGYNSYIAARGAEYSNKVDSNVTGVEDVLLGGENGEVVYYNLQGMRIDEPTAAGVYFRVEGKNVTKVVVK